MNNAIFREIRMRRYDVVYVAGMELLPYLIGSPDIPIIVDLVDDETISKYQEARLERKFIQKVRLFKWWYEFKRFRDIYVPRFKELVVTSHVDADSIRKICPKSNIHMVPNGVDIDYFNPSKDTKEIFPVLCFSGVMAYEPNDDAMLYFIHKIYPLIKEKCHNIKLMIIGKEPSTQLRNLVKNDKSVTITGYVRDIRPYLKRVTLYVCPLRMGSGIKNKILEAWAMRKPIVATPISCDGLDVIPGKNIVIANHPHDFARQVLKLLDNEERRRNLAQNGRKWVECHYSWQSQSFKLESIFFEALRKNRLYSQPQEIFN